MPLNDIFTEEMKLEMTNGLEEGELVAIQASKIRAAVAAAARAVFNYNSKLATVTKLSPNCTKPRNHAIDRLTPHHMAGKLSVESALAWFAKESTQASCNYCIDYEGRIGLCVDEANRPWTTSSRANDNRAITFEVSNIGGASEGWPISEKSFEALVALCTDICERYGKTKLLYIDNKDKALSYEPKEDEMILTKHEWFANTTCPGPSLGAKFPELAARVTKNLNAEEDDEEMVRYKTVEEMPKQYRADTQTLIDKGLLRGKGGDAGLDITEDMARTLIICGRMLGVLK